MHSPSRSLVVAAALVDDLDHPTRLLAARRKVPVALSGRWEFPGGKVEPGESPEAGLHRELAEELGIRVTLGSAIPGPDDEAWIITDNHVLRLWWARIVEGVPEPLAEHDRLEWLPVGRWLDVPWLDADVRIVEHLVGVTPAASHTPMRLEDG